MFQEDINYLFAGLSPALARSSSVFAHTESDINDFSMKAIRKHISDCIWTRNPNKDEFILLILRGASLNLLSFVLRLK